MEALNINNIKKFYNQLKRAGLELTINVIGLRDVITNIAIDLKTGLDCDSEILEELWEFGLSGCVEGEEVDIDAHVLLNAVCKFIRINNI